MDTATLQGKVVVITGGARGMGAAYSKAFLDLGSKVVSTDLSWGGADDLKATIEMSGGLALLMDITKGEQVDAAYQATIDRFGTVDVLINNAGMRQRDLYPPHGRVTALETSDEDWERMFAVNVFGTLKVIRRFIQPMLAQGRGSIVNVCSSGLVSNSQGGSYAALRPHTREMPYMSSKAALANLGFYLADEVKEQNVAVNMVLPGHTRSTGSDEQQKLREAMGAVPMPMVRPEHMLPLVTYLATCDAATLTGRMFDVMQWNIEHGLGGRDAWLAND